MLYWFSVTQTIYCKLKFVVVLQEKMSGNENDYESGWPSFVDAPYPTNLNYHKPPPYWHRPFQAPFANDRNQLRVNWADDLPPQFGGRSSKPLVPGSMAYTFANMHAAGEVDGEESNPVFPPWMDKALDIELDVRKKKAAPSPSRTKLIERAMLAAMKEIKQKKAGQQKKKPKPGKKSSKK